MIQRQVSGPYLERIATGVEGLLKQNMASANE